MALTFWTPSWSPPWHACAKKTDRRRDMTRNNLPVWRKMPQTPHTKYRAAGSWNKPSSQKLRAYHTTTNSPLTYQSMNRFPALAPTLASETVSNSSSTSFWQFIKRIKRRKRKNKGYTVEGKEGQKKNARFESASMRTCTFAKKGATSW